MADQFRGKVYPYYYVKCALCGEEESLGVTQKSQVAFHLERSGYIQLKPFGYIHENCWTAYEPHSDPNKK